jgi:WD40 repeat protein
MLESNWLHGGHIQCTRVANDNGVVTSLAMNGELMAVGMATAKIHIFRSTNGEFVKTLIGHELGVWCLVLISPGGGNPPKWGTPENSEDDGSDGDDMEENEDEDDDAVGDAHSGNFAFSLSPTPAQRMAQSSATATRVSINRTPADLATYRDDGLSRRASFNGVRMNHLDPPTQYSSSPALGSPTGRHPQHRQQHYPTMAAQAQQGLGTMPVRTATAPPVINNSGSSSSLPSSSRGRPEVPVAPEQQYVPTFEDGHTPPPSTGPPPRKARRMPQSDVRGSATGWGQPGPVIVSGGCDRHLRVWDVNSG